MDEFIIFDLICQLYYYEFKQKCIHGEDSY